MKYERHLNLSDVYATGP